jgi:type IV pilus assembly protein PilP
MLKYILVSLGVLSLSACSNDKQDLHAWIAQIKTKTVSQSATIPPLKEYINQPYTANNMVSPFSSLKVGNAVLEAPPDGDRPKEPLETIPIDNIFFVGILKQDNRTKAMLKIENKIYQVVIGNHIGQDYGKITEIKETGLTVRELIKDGENKWTEKIVTLPLKEGA